MDSIGKNPDEQFKKYIEDTLRECATLPAEEKRQGLQNIWTKPEIIKYYAKLPIDEPTKHLAASLSETLPGIEKKKILCVGGAVGRLGRYIASLDPNYSIVEVDMSEQMVREANKLA